MFEEMIFYGENLTKARKIRNMSMPDVVTKSNDNISQAYISDLEKGKSEAPTIEKINILAEALDFPWYYFFFKDGKLPINFLPEMPLEKLKFVMNPEHDHLIDIAMAAGESTLSIDTIMQFLKETKARTKRVPGQQPGQAT